jgi:hypothetical protein
MRGLNGPSRGRFFIAKGGRACGRLMFPRPRTKKDSRPSSQSQKCLRREKEKETKLYMDGGKRHTSAGRDDRGRFTTGTQLEVSIARHRCRSVCSAAFTFTAAERGGHSSPWRSPPLLLLLLLHFRLLCACA